MENITNRLSQNPYGKEAHIVHEVTYGILYTVFHAVVGEIWLPW